MIPSVLRQDKSWVVVKKDSKVPMQTNDNPANTSDQDTWNSYARCKVAVADGSYDNIGYVFHDTDIIGIDIDYGVTDGVLSEEIQSIVDMCDSYAEYSRSGRGVHIYLKGQLPFDGRNNRKGYEIYKSGRYFIVTEKPVNNVPIKENQSAIDWLLENKFAVVSCDQFTFNERVYSPVWHIRDGHIPYPEYPPIEQGCRNLSLLSLGGQLMSQGYTDREIYLELLKVNQTACTPPLTMSEVQSIVTSVGRYRR